MTATATRIPRHAKPPRKRSLLLLPLAIVALFGGVLLLFTLQGHPRAAQEHPPAISRGYPMTLAPDFPVPPEAVTIAPRTYSVRNGDTLSSIAQRFCGNPLDYQKTAGASRINPAGILPLGKVLTIDC